MGDFTLTRDQLETLVRCALDLEAVLDAGFGVPKETMQPSKATIENVINEYK